MVELLGLFGGGFMEVSPEIRMPNPESSLVGQINVAKTVTLSERDVRDAARLFRLISNGALRATMELFEPEEPDNPSAGHVPKDQLIPRARSALPARRLRSRHFNRVMFGEPAWDILLLLYLAESSESRQTIGQLAELVETPPTTALRWVAYLEKEHLVERQSHPTDRRIVFIELTDKGRDALRAYLSETSG